MGMSGIAHASRQLMRVRDANSRSAKAWPRNRTKYTYDANGNVATRNGLAISWTSYNHPLVINSPGESVQFAYKQDHTRWSAIYNGSTGIETTYFVGDLLEKVITAGVSDYRHFIYADGTKVASTATTRATARTTATTTTARR